MTIKEKIALCWRILKKKPGNLYRHAEAELPDPECGEMQAEMNRDLLEVVFVFSSQGHSGFSASYALGALKKLLDFQPLGPLTGDDGEWTEVRDGLHQNRRCSRVFKDINGYAYDIEGRVFREPGGACFTSIDSRVPVTFPYTPTTEYVDTSKEAEG